MKVYIEKAIGAPEELKKYSKNYRVVTTDNNGLYCTEVVHKKGITRAFSKSHDSAVNNALKEAINILKIS
jgi:hypothetical protein